MKTYHMTSRKKDNGENYQQRDVVLISKEFDDKVKREWEHFIADSKDGEVVRLYESINKRDEKKVKKALQIRLLDEDVNLFNIDRLLVSIASKPENALEKKWLIDFDDERIEDFLKDLEKLSVGKVEVHKTINGYAVITERGFDTRDILSKYNAELKRDDYLLIDWRKK